MSRIFYIARHGQTVWNAEMRIQGQENIPLTRDGYRNRRGLFYLLKDKPIKHIYTSALQRSINTAFPIAQYLHLPIQTTSNLNEISFGLLEGENLSDFDEWAEQTWNWWLKNPFENRVPGGGENYLDLLKRADIFLSSLNQHNDQDVTLVVAHFRINQMLIGRLTNMKIEEAITILQPNNQVYRIQKKENDSAEIEYTFTSTNVNEEITWQPGLLTSETALDPRQRMSVKAG